MAGRKNSTSPKTMAARRKAAMEELQAFGTPIPGTTPEGLIENILDTLAGQLKMVNEKIPTIEADDFWRQSIAGPIPNEWIGFQRDLMDRIYRYSHSAVGLGLRKRQLELEEAQAMMMLRAIQGACESIGLNKAQQQQLGAALREQLEVEAKKELNP